MVLEPGNSGVQFAKSLQSSHLADRMVAVDLHKLEGGYKDPSELHLAHPDDDEFKALLDVAIEKHSRPLNDVAIPLTEATPEHTTDLGNAKRFVTLFGDDVRYCHPLKTWFVWNGSRWAPDPGYEMPRRAEDVVKSIYSEAAVATESSTRTTLSDWARKCETLAAINAMQILSQTQPGIPIAPDELDSDRWLLNVRNGTIDLRTGQLREHRRADLITKLIDIDYVPGARCEDFELLIEFITRGDKELMDYIQKAVGYTATGDVREEQCFLVVGQGGTGKSTLFEALHTNLGDYAARTTMQTFTKGHGVGGARPDLVRLHNARFVSCIEIADGTALDEEKVKGMVSGDRQAARALYQSEFEFDPQFKLWFGANSAPQVDAHDSGMWRRMKQIDANRKVTHPDKDLKIRLKAAPHPGILNWMIAGCMEWQKDGLAEPESVQRATQIYRLDNDELADFFGEICVFADDLTCRFSDLWAAYSLWTIQNDVSQRDRLTQRAFGRQLTQRGFHPTKGTGGVRNRIGLGLVAQVAQKRVFSQNSPRESSREKVSESSATTATTATPSWSLHDAYVAVQNHDNWLDSLTPEQRAAADAEDARELERLENEIRENNYQEYLEHEAEMQRITDEGFVTPDERDEVGY